jgi:hypothetical protein
VNVQPALETNAQLAEAGKTCMRSFDDSTILAQSIAAFEALAGNACRDASSS